jgi:hypothetical protein
MSVRSHLGEVMLGRKPQTPEQKANAAAAATERAVADRQSAALARAAEAPTGASDAEPATTEGGSRLRRPRRQTAADRGPAPAQLSERAGSSIIRVALPSGKVADHPWEALYPSDLRAAYTDLDVRRSRKTIEDTRLSLFADDEGQLLKHIRPRYVSEDKLYYELGDRFYTTLVISSWPNETATRTLRPSFWEPILLRIPEVSLSIHHNRIPIRVAERDIVTSMRNLSGNLEDARARGKSTEEEINEMEAKQARLLAYKQSVITREQAPFHLSAYIRVGAESLDKLNEKVKIITDFAAHPLGVSILQLPGDQRDAMISSMPFGTDQAYQTKYMSSFSAAHLMPFITRQRTNINGVTGRTDGVLYGLQAYNQTPVVMSPWVTDVSGRVVNVTTVVGEPGAGKSFWMRCYLGRMAMIGTQLLVIDPIGDYRRFFKMNPEGSQSIEIHAESGTHLNPLKREWDIEVDGLESIPSKVGRLIPLFALLLGDSFTDSTKNLIAGALTSFYEKYDGEEKLMEDFIAFLRNYDQISAASNETLLRRDRIVDDLNLKCTASDFKNYFKYRSNVDLSARRIHFDLLRAQKIGGEHLVFATYMAMELALTVANRNGERKMILVDEMWQLFSASRNAEAVGQMLNSLIRTRRHWNTAVTFATQFFDDESHSEVETGQRAVIGGTDIWIVFRQSDIMLRQTVELVGQTAQFDFLRSFLQNSSGQSRGAVIFTKEREPIPIFSIGLPFEKAENDENSGTLARED